MVGGDGGFWWSSGAGGESATMPCRREALVLTLNTVGAVDLRDGARSDLAIGCSVVSAEIDYRPRLDSPSIVGPLTSVPRSKSTSAAGPAGSGAAMAALASATASTAQEKENFMVGGCGMRLRECVEWTRQALREKRQPGKG